MEMCARARTATVAAMGAIAAAIVIPVGLAPVFAGDDAATQSDNSEGVTVKTTNGEVDTSEAGHSKSEAKASASASASASSRSGSEDGQECEANSSASAEATANGESQYKHDEEHVSKQGEGCQAEARSSATAGSQD